MRACQQTKKRQRGRRRKQKDDQKVMAPIDWRFVKSGHRSKCGFYHVKLTFSMLARTHFFSSWANQWQSRRDPRGGPGRPRGPFPNFRGAPRDPKGSRSLSKRGLGGALRAPWVVKMRNGDPKCVFEIVEKTLVFIANLDMPLCQSV